MRISGYINNIFPLNLIMLKIFFKRKIELFFKRLGQIFFIDFLKLVIIRKENYVNKKRKDCRDIGRLWTLCY